MLSIRGEIYYYRGRIVKNSKEIKAKGTKYNLTIAKNPLKTIAIGELCCITIFYCFEALLYPLIYLMGLCYLGENYKDAFIPS